MKKIIALFLVVVISVCFAACDGKNLGKQTLTDDEHGVVEYNTVNSFDFSDFQKEHEATAKTDGFVNVEAKEFYNKTDAKELAKNELPDGYSYNTIKIFYDRTEGIWKVEFSTVDKETDAVSSKISVCVEDTGYTKLIVEE